MLLQHQDLNREVCCHTPLLERWYLLLGAAQAVCNPESRPMAGDAAAGILRTKIIHTIWNRETPKKNKEHIQISRTPTNERQVSDVQRIKETPRNKDKPQKAHWTTTASATNHCAKH